MYIMIEKIAQEIAFDNGAVNRYQSIADITARLGDFLLAYETDFLDDVEVFLTALNHQEMIDLACGDQDEQARILNWFEEENTDWELGSLDGFLNEIFDEVI